jgi:hypothetical protein
MRPSNWLGGQPVAARTVEGLVIFVSVTVFAIFAALMQNNPKADLYMPGDHSDGRRNR